MNLREFNIQQRQHQLWCCLNVMRDYDAYTDADLEIILHDSQFPVYVEAAAQVLREREAAILYNLSEV
jgi:hypothetical protein